MLGAELSLKGKVAWVNAEFRGDLSIAQVAAASGRLIKNYLIGNRTSGLSVLGQAGDNSQSPLRVVNRRADHWRP